MHVNIRFSHFVSAVPHDTDYHVIAHEKSRRNWNTRPLYIFSPCVVRLLFSTSLVIDYTMRCSFNCFECSFAATHNVAIVQYTIISDIRVPLQRSTNWLIEAPEFSGKIANRWRRLSQPWVTLKVHATYSHSLPSLVSVPSSFSWL